MSEACWLYAGEDQKQHGPITTDEFKKKFDAGEIKLSTLAWKQGLQAWAPASAIAELSSVTGVDLADMKHWLYADKQKQQQGPVSKKDLKILYNEFKVSDATLVWRQGLPSWQRLVEVPELSDVVNPSDAALETPDLAPPVQPPLPPRTFNAQFNDEEDARDDDEEDDDDEQQQQALSAAAAEEMNLDGPEYQQPAFPYMHDDDDDEDEELYAMRAGKGKRGGMAAGRGGRGRGRGGAPGRAAAAAPAPVKPANPAAADGSTPAAEGEEEKKKEKRKRKAKKPKWKENKEHCNVYVSGLPNNITVDEMYEYFKKCGIIKEDPLSLEKKIKIYKDEQGRPKGDGLVGYLKEESVTLAVDLLDGSEIRPGHKINVSKAEFKMKGEAYIPAKRQKVDPTAAKLRKKLAGLEKTALSWDEESGDVPVVAKKGLRIVILKHMFHPSEAQGDPSFYHDLRDDVSAECSRVAGPVEKVTVFEGNIEGAIAVKFEDALSARKCLEVMNGRFFAQRQIMAEYFDGVTNYKVTDSDEQEEERLKSFGDWLEGQKGEDGAQKK